MKKTLSIEERFDSQEIVYIYNIIYVYNIIYIHIYILEKYIKQGLENLKRKIVLFIITMRNFNMHFSI